MTENGAHPPAPVGAYGVSQTFPPLDTGWRTFPRHYLLYASAGTAHLEVASAQWWLPPHRAAWIAADVPIRVRIDAPLRSCSVLFATGFIPRPAFDCRVFTVSVLAREMLLYAMRWGEDRAQPDDVADRFFLALAEVCSELAMHPDHFWLPGAQSPELARAIDYTLRQLADHPSFAETAWSAGVSERTLTRRFAEETHMTWRQYVRRARMIRAAALLAETDSSITEIVYATGFESVSAFISAFRSVAGETPSQYRKRLKPR
jgi:AraC-like DNA-binding protein